MYIYIYTGAGSGARFELPIRAGQPCILVLWLIYYICIVLDEILKLKWPRRGIIDNEKSMYGQTKFEESDTPNTMATLPGLGLGTKRPKMKETGAIETSTKTKYKKQSYTIDPYRSAETTSSNPVF